MNDRYREGNPTTQMPALGRTRPIGTRQFDFPSVLTVLTVADIYQ
jgi:hypothetical protein